MLLNCDVGEDSWESLGLQGDTTSPFWRRWALGFLWKEWCSSWNSSTLATSWEELTHWKRLWCWGWGVLGARGEGDDREWDGWMASLTWWIESEWTPGVGDGQGGLACCNSWGRKELDRTERLNWTEPGIGFPWWLSDKNLPAMQEKCVQSLGWEDPLEKKMTMHSSILVWEIPWRENPGGLQFTGSQKSLTQLNDQTTTRYKQ